MSDVNEFWSIPAAELIARLRTTAEGLTATVAAERLAQHGENVLKSRHEAGSLALFLAQFKSPLIIILIFAAGLAFFLGETTNAAIIFVIVLLSGSLGFWQERGAARAVKKLLAIIQIKVSVMRDGSAVSIPASAVVPGDVMLLEAGDSVP
ncbi:MAG: cation-transporting P-type ATPase, partial [Candidatus Krumholzibacteria bacterium]|nr:cation-transporting P-type ATPase [Candidatus Krumholzibacteria bacterium]